jgi:putative nucleotidyltransferase with HDIG domain
MPDYEKVKRLASSILALRETYNHHGPRVAVLATKLAASAGLPVDQVALIEVGSHLHDIGKVLIRKDLLNMPRVLTSEEISEMRLHATYGWTIVNASGFDPIICDIVRHHHERYDGDGYPDRLQGENVPLAARIVTICDVYEAMTHQRTYRAAFSHDLTRSYMLSGSGRVFDADLLDLFFERVLHEPVQW